MNHPQKTKSFDYNKLAITDAFSSLDSKQTNAVCNILISTFSCTKQNWEKTARKYQPLSGFQVLFSPGGVKYLLQWCTESFCCLHITLDITSWCARIPSIYLQSQKAKVKARECLRLTGPTQYGCLMQRSLPTINGAETNCGIARILGILLMNSWDT